MNDTPLIQAEHLIKRYQQGNESIAAVNDVSLTIRTGDFIAFVGPSGSGKTTLLNMLGFLDNPSSGSISLQGHPVIQSGSLMKEKQLTHIRRQYFGYVFQKFYLIPTLTVAENTMLPLAFYRRSSIQEKDIDDLLKRLGILQRKHHFPNQISGGEMQRVAIARALVNQPSILLADEPTGNLDSHKSREIGQILHELNHDYQLTIILVTHNNELAAMAKTVTELRDGCLHA